MHRNRDSWGRPPLANPALWLADWVFLLFHDERDGKPRIDLDLIGLGLAAAALHQLAEQGFIEIKPPGGDVIRWADSWPTDPTQAFVFQEIVRNEHQTFTATDWIFVLRGQMYRGVAADLVKRGLVKQDDSGMGRRSRYIPTPRSNGETALGRVQILSGFRLDHIPKVHLMMAAICHAVGAASAVVSRTDNVASAYETILNTLDPRSVLLLRSVERAKAKVAMLPARH